MIKLGVSSEESRSQICFIWAIIKSLDAFDTFICNKIIQKLLQP